MSSVGLGALKMPDLTIQDLTMTDQIAGVGNAIPHKDESNDRAEYAKKMCPCPCHLNGQLIFCWPVLSKVHLLTKSEVSSFN